MSTETYRAEHITVLEGLEGVRRRPAMYIGDTGERGLHHLLNEVVDNSVDEAMAGHCTEIVVTLHADRSASVEDNGRGIPVDIHPQVGRPALEVVLTRLHAGGKFSQKAYKISGGLHGVGVSVVNALSERLVAEVFREGKIYRQVFARGIPQTDLQVIGETEKRGTRIRFWPDPEIFGEQEFQYETVLRRLKDLAYLNRGLKIVLRSERPGEPEERVLQFDEGIRKLVENLNQKKEVLFTPPFYFEGKKDSLLVECAFQYVQEDHELVLTFANNIRTLEGGMHLKGFQNALSQAIRSYIRQRDLLKGRDKKLQILGDDVRDGLTAVLSVKLPEPQFEGQTKTRLGNREVQSQVYEVLVEAIGTFLDRNPDIARRIVDRVLLAARARVEARRAAEVVRKTALAGASLPGKLTDCITRNPEEAELFIVEGDSAGGSAKQARDARTQAILPIRGKILNVEKATRARALESEEIRNLITALGTGIGEQFDLAKLRYHKVIIMTDADVDGQHIRILLLTLFYKYLHELIESGFVYIALTPLYRVRKGTKTRYVYDEEELQRLLEGEMKGAVVTRFKGLGEMPPEVLWETSMNPKTRRLVRVTIEDAERAEQLLTSLMGKDVEERKQFLIANAKFAENLDV